jgi:arabinogalactan oligomer/maltooligosaccharide transport system substrate-binding protein
MPAAPEMRCAWDAMRPNLEGVMAGTLKPADAAKAMQQAADQCVAELGKK